MNPVSCELCGETWETDPRLLVLCPSCNAAPLHPCRRPSGHNCEFHIAREQTAIDAGVMSICKATPAQQTDIPPLQPQLQL